MRNDQFPCDEVNQVLLSWILTKCLHEDNLVPDDLKKMELCNRNISNAFDEKKSLLVQEWKKNGKWI